MPKTPNPFDADLTLPQQQTADAAFEHAFEELILVEGGYSDHPADRGGKTMYGITEEVARAAGYHGPMDQLDLDTAKNIYRSRYWNVLRLDDIAVMCPEIAYKLFDIGVNMGCGRAAEFQQRALNVLNREQKDYDNIDVDHAIGPITVATLEKYLAKRGKAGVNPMLKALNSLQGQFYIRLAETSSPQQQFVYGWLDKRVSYI